MNLRIWEINIVQMLSLSLAAVLVGPVHAQSVQVATAAASMRPATSSAPNEVVVSAGHPFWDRRATDSLVKASGGRLRRRSQRQPAGYCEQLRRPARL
jgi:hypothetical protein